MSSEELRPRRTMLGENGEKSKSVIYIYIHLRPPPTGVYSPTARASDWTLVSSVTTGFSQPPSLGRTRPWQLRVGRALSNTGSTTPRLKRSSAKRNGREVTRIGEKGQKMESKARTFLTQPFRSSHRSSQDYRDGFCSGRCYSSLC